MMPTPETLARLQRSQLDALDALTKTWIHAGQEIASANLAAARAMLGDVQPIADRAPDNRPSAQGPGADPDLAAMAQALSTYAVQLFGIARRASAQLLRVAGAQADGTSNGVSELAGLAFPSGSFGSQVSVLFLKTAFSASRVWFDAWTNSATQPPAPSARALPPPTAIANACVQR